MKARDEKEQKPMARVMGVIKVIWRH